LLHVDNKEIFGKVFKEILEIAVREDMNLDRIIERFIDCIEMLPIDLRKPDGELYQWQDVNTEKIYKLHNMPLPFENDGECIWDQFRGGNYGEESSGFSFWNIFWCCGCGSKNRKLDINKEDIDNKRCYVIPVKGLAHLEALEMLKKCRSIWKPSLFKSEVMGHVVEVFWNEAIAWDQTKEMLQYLLLMITYTTAAKWIEHWSWDLGGGYPVTAACAYASGLNSLVFLWYEVEQMQSRSFSVYIQNQFNVCQVLMNLCVIGSLCWGHFAPQDHLDAHYPLIMASLTTLIMFLLSSYYLRGYAQFTWLISVVVQIFFEAIPFITILIIIVASFTSAFYCLGISDDWLMSFFMTWTMAIVGEKDMDEDELIHPWISRILYIFLVILLMIVGMNAIIAFMGDTYDKSKVKDSKISETRFQRMDLFLELADSWSRKKKKKVGTRMDKYIHMLRAVDIKRQDWEGHTVYLTQRMDANAKSITDELQINKRQADTDAKKTSAAIDNLNQELQDLKADHSRQIDVLSTDFKRKMLDQEDNFKKQIDFQTKLKNDLLTKLQEEPKENQEIQKRLKELEIQNQKLLEKIDEERQPLVDQSSLIMQETSEEINKLREENRKLLETHNEEMKKQRELLEKIHKEKGSSEPAQEDINKLREENRELLEKQSQELKEQRELLEKQNREMMQQMKEVFINVMEGYRQESEKKAAPKAKPKKGGDEVLTDADEELPGDVGDLEPKESDIWKTFTE